jgi:hypothetical protein
MTALTKTISRKADAAADVDWGVNPNIVVTLYPPTQRGGAVIGLKESKRSKKTELTIEVGRLYGTLLKWKINGERLVRAKAKSEAKKLRRKLR